MIELSLRQEEAKLAYLAVAYHLGRPGSELDPVTKLPVEHGLAETAQALQPQLRLAIATISLRDNQLSRLQSAMLGTISELKAYSMLELRPTAGGGGHRSTVPGFDASLAHLFPEVEEDPERSLDVAERMLLFKRNLDQKLGTLPREPDPEEAQPPQKRGWWPFGRKA